MRMGARGGEDRDVWRRYVPSMSCGVVHRQQQMKTQVQVCSDGGSVTAAPARKRVRREGEVEMRRVALGGAHTVWGSG
jgi:hypothetical protein